VAAEERRGARRNGKSLGSWKAGEGLHGLALYSPPSPPPSPPPDTETTKTESTNTETSLDPGTVQSGANAVAAPAPRRKPAVAAPVLVVARSRLITSGRSLVLDTGLRATCPARGPRAATIRAGSGPAVVRKTSVRVKLRRLSDSR
jgi:hypothetical protein